MSDLWMPGAERQPQGQAVRLDTSLPPRAVWHITADKLDGAGNPPPLDNVGNYLKNVAYCPTLMWDPITGRTIQYYPADVGARALTRWNEDGRVNIQIETYFSYGVVRNGVRYNSVAETPAVGLDRILEWLDGFGIPRVWPAGAPVMGANRQDVNIWNTQAGHYGHSQVPGETHVDPGPMPSFDTTTDLLIPGVAGLSK